MIKVDAKARLHADRAGEPLDGLVNMFDIGIILSVGFLVAALQALNQLKLLTHEQTVPVKEHTKIVVIHPHETKVPVKSTTPKGVVYENPSGELIYVETPPPAKTAETGKK